MTGLKKLLTIWCTLVWLGACAAEVIPPAPAKFFNDYAGVVSTATGAQLDQRLQQFERDFSCQIVVAVFPKMQSDSSIEDYTVRVAQSWKVGQKDKNNGAVLFVFSQDRKMFLQVGYGLEGVMPDALCKRIIEDEIKPSFRAGNYDAGLIAGVNAILAATKGEYKGTGQTAADRNPSLGPMNRSDSFPILFLVIIVFALILFALSRSRFRGGSYYSGNGWSGWGNSWGGDSSSGGGFSSGGGGDSFSGGGGSFGGGGAGGSW